MAEAFPIWVIVIDYVLGAVMWTLIGRTGMNIFLPEDSTFFFMRFFVRVTNPLLHWFCFITPSFRVRPIVPLCVAGVFFMLRISVMPWLLGYDVMGMLSFPLESDIAHFIYRIGN